MMRKKIFTFFLSVFFILTTLSTNAYAYNTFNQHKLIYGVGNYGNNTQHYWIDETASEYTSYIDAAINEWKYTTSYWGITTPIWYTKTTSSSNSRMDIVKVDTINEWWGLTLMYNGTEINPYSSNWIWGKILLDGDFSQLSGSSSDNRRKAVIAHEMGHVMGLAHTSFTNAIMRADIAYCSPGIFRAQPNDLAGINYLY
ncbi:matrixin family metalloprotease [Clostridium sp. SYSU_GA19001]|uniref:matrixin family metalloprotease n=1 Tax=Clostridium caldaquaticum TaxID=2940653 RepID=UPI0020773602|nr:matrixin family metalloprotease [Clostridium caldaquaticum]MCM8709458.1 matrixin family metalloprotease [Clostridium caldaquaticum]